MKLIKRLFSSNGANAARVETKLPDDFDPAVYLKLHVDVRDAGVDPAQHYREFGWAENRPYQFPPLEYAGRDAFDSGRRTALLVTHECSLTGAPVLVYNMAEVLSKTMNVVVLSLGAGTLESLFKELDIVFVSAHKARASIGHAEHAVGCIAREFSPAFAIVNSIESQMVVEPLAQAGIPTVSLIHEFAPCYTDPAARFKTMMTVPDQVVFSSEVTFKDAARFVKDFDADKIHILPQGRSNVPRKRVADDSTMAEQQRLRAIMRPEGERARPYVVLGVGAVNYRKGIDLFLQCARQIAANVGEEKCRFVWIGQGYEPRKDPAYSVYLEDQILRSGLTSSVEIIGETTELETAYELADLFVLSSRLDPLPNVGIDAMFFNKPLVCFDKTTGIVSFLESVGLKEACIAEYLDVNDLAEKASRLLVSTDLKAQVAQTLEAHVAGHFNMERYVTAVAALVAPVK